MQREVRSAVIEGRFLPAFAVMTLLTGRTQASGVAVLREMAAVAIFRYRVLHAPARVATGAIGA